MHRGQRGAVEHYSRSVWVAESTMRGGKGTKATLGTGGGVSTGWDDAVYTISILGADDRRRAVGGGGLHRLWNTGCAGDTGDGRGTTSSSIAV